MRAVVSIPVASVALFVGLQLTAGRVVADGPIPIEQLDRSQPVSFEDEVLPILRRKCLACHNQTEEQGGLVLETPQTMIAGGDSGPAIVARASGKSLLLKLASHAGEPVMPPADNLVDASPLTPKELGLIQLWVDQGARGNGISSGRSPTDWRPLPPGINPIYAVAVSADGRFAACSRANQIFIYHVATGQPLTRLNDPELQALDRSHRPGAAHLDLVQALRFNPAGDMLASSGFRTVKLWQRPSDVVLHKLPATDNAAALAVQASGGLVAVAAGKNIQLWDARAGQQKAELKGHEDEVTGVRFLGDRLLVSAARDATVRLWSIPAGETLGSLTTGSPLNAVEVVPANSDVLQTDSGEAPDLTAWRIVTAGDDAVVRVWQFPAIGSPEAEAPAANGEADSGDSDSNEADSGEAKAEEAASDPAAAPLLERELKGHSGSITSLAVVPGAAMQVVSSGRDGTARHWNLGDGRLLRQFNHGGPVNSVAMQAGGSRLATGGENARIRLWELQNGRQVVEVRGDLRAVARTAELVREQKTAAARQNAAKKSLEEAQKALPATKESAKKLADALAGANKKVDEQTATVKKTSDAKSAAEKTAIEKSTAAQRALAAKLAAEQRADETAALARLADDKAKRLAALAAQSPADEDLKRAAERAQQEASQLAAQAQAAASARTEPTRQADQAVKVAKDAADEAATTQKPYNDAVAALEKAEAEQNLASQQDVLGQRELAVAEAAVPAAQKRLQDADRKLAEVEANLATAREAEKEAEKPIHCVVFSPDGKTLFSGNADGTIHAWDGESGVATASYVGQRGPVRALATSLGGASIISAAARDPVHVWDANPGWRLARVIGSIDDASRFADRVRALDFSSDGRLLATGGGEPSRSGHVKVWDVDSGQLVQEFLNAHDDAVLGVKFSPDSERIASCGADKFVRTFDVATGQSLRRFEGHTNYVLDVAWNGDGSRLASAGADALVKIWNSETGDQLRTISNFDKQVTGIRFIGDTPNIASSCGDARVRLHRSDNGSLFRNLTGSGDFLHGVDISGDGAVVVAGCHDSVLRIWDGNNGQLKQSLALDER